MRNPTNVAAPDAAAVDAHAAGVTSPVASGRVVGLYPADGFRLTNGRCSDCATEAAALWYFGDQTIAVPAQGRDIAGFARGVTAIADIEAWRKKPEAVRTLAYPPLAWVAAPQLAEGARLAPDAASLVLADGTTMPLALVPRIATNSAYFDASSARFFGARDVKIRGTLERGTLVARTIWPEEFALTTTLRDEPLNPQMSTVEALRALVRALPHGGATAPFAAQALWRRDADALAPGRAVVAIILNGAQGDDDEAHGGHFAIVTGRTRQSGAIGDWLVNNFYSLDIESEKGIVAAAVPLDNYLADLNSGQGYYRPSYMLVAVLSDDRAARLVQGALNRIYNQFYRHQLVYHHATMNCAGISVDVLRALGLPVAFRGPTGQALAAVALPYTAVAERSLVKGKNAYDYLVEDRTRLLPAAAFEEIGASLVALTRSAADARAGTLAHMLHEDVAALAFLRFPQLPSSRVIGDAPVVSTADYRTRIPRRRADFKAIPVPPRPFPESLRDPDVLPVPRRASDNALVAWVVALAAAIALAVCVAAWM